MLKKVLLNVSGILLVVILIVYFSPYRYLLRLLKLYISQVILLPF